MVLGSLKKRMVVYKQYNPFLVYCRELAPGTVSLTRDRAQGDDSKHDSHYRLLIESVNTLPSNELSYMFIGIYDKCCRNNAAFIILALRVDIMSCHEFSF